jgi:uncharacterized protein YpmS
MQWLMDWLTDPSTFDPLVFVVLVALTILLTLGSIVWLVLEREDPSTAGRSDETATDASAALARIAARHEREAARVRRELDVEAGRGPGADGGARR